MDRGLKAVWYDLDDAHREEHVNWVHEVYLPALRARQGYAWVGHYRTIPSRTGDDRARLNECPDPSVGRGTQYLLLIGAPTADVFFARGESDAPQRLDAAEVNSRLAQRIGGRLCVYTEETRLNGPEYARSVLGAPPGPIIQLGSFNTLNDADALELGAYYRQNRFPAMATSPGCVSTRKLVATVGWARHGILYEFTSLEKRRDNFEEHVEWGSDPRIARADNPYRWPGRFPTEYVVFAPGAPTVATRIWPQDEF
jgi:hypothetical protein